MPITNALNHKTMEPVEFFADKLMVRILDGNSENVAHAWWKIGRFGEKYPICAGSLNNQKPYTGQITDISPYVRTYLWNTI